MKIKPITKIVDDCIYIRKKGIYYPYKEAVSSRKHSWITFQQISLEYPQFLNKIADILFCSNYDEKAKDYTRNILVWLENWQFVSWKQFDSIFRICESYREYKASIKQGTSVLKYQGITSIRRGNFGFTYVSKNGETIPLDLSTDKSVDKLCEVVFGSVPFFEEEIEEGMEKHYRSDGSRYFSIPTLDMDLSDFII